MGIKRNANNALRQLSLEDLKSVFANLMNTEYMFWDLLDYVYESKPELVYEYLIAKLLNDCPERVILEETQDYPTV